ncbi:MAG: hypothetical protein ACOCP4_02055 [Candidatus Woesearchaeota archaeon]
MKNYFKKYHDDFLNPDESNFKLISKRINYFFKKVRKKVDNRSARINIDKVFSYDEELAKTFIPEKGLDDKNLINGAAEAFEGVIRFHHPNTLFNITPPPAIDTVAISAITNIYNPNLLWDYVSGKIMLYELKVVKYLCDIAGFDYKKASGFSCFGGKGTLMYAIKEGLNNVDRTTVKTGLKGDNVVITAKACHYAVESACNYLGMGHDACVRVECNDKEEIMVDSLEKSIRENLDNNKKIVAIILSGGGTLDINIDPIKEVAKLRDNIVKEYKLDYVPHIHVDSVIGWLWMFFNGYDFNKNDLGIEKDVLDKIEKTYLRISETKYADSFSADLHKTGFCPYVSSFYVSASKASVSSLDKESEIESLGNKYGEIQMYQSSIENSRSGAGIMSAWTVINKFGKNGFREYVAYLISSSIYMKKILKEKYQNEYEILNDFASGYCIMIKPKLREMDIDFYKMIEASDETKKYYNNYCADFYKYISYETMDSNYPLLGYLAKYRQRTMNTGLAAFRIFPSSLYYDKKTCEDVIEKIVLLKRKFEEERDNKQSSFKKYTTHSHQPS